MSGSDEVFGKVKQALVDALGVDDDEVTPQATLIGDLGTESIDFLDIMFKLDKAFGIKWEKGELYPDDVLTNPAFIADGKINAEGIKQLKERMPFADLSRLEANPQVQTFANLLTVADLVRFVEHKLKQKG